MLEAVALARDIVIILTAIIVAAVAIIVGRRLTDLMRQVEAVRYHARAVVTGFVNPLKGLLLAVRRYGGRKR